MSITKMKRRTLIIFTIFITLLGILIFRLAYWQLVRGEELKGAASQQQTSKTTITASRGKIYDRNGKVLAESGTVNTLVCNPQDVKDDGDANVAADKLAAVIDIDREKIYSQLTKSNRYQVIKKRLSVEETNKIKDLKNKEIDKEVAKALTGVYFEEDSKRYYSFNVAPHIIGFTGYDNNGLQGIELTFDDELTGKDGAVNSLRNADGTTLSESEYESVSNSASGADVVLTIDETIQHFLEKHLENAVEENKLKEGAAGIIMNPKTGEVLAMSTKPDFDINNPYDTSIFEQTAIDYQYESKLENAQEELESIKESQKEAALSEALEAAMEAAGGENFDKEKFIKEFEKSYKAPASSESPEMTEAQQKLQQEKIAAMRNKMWRNKAVSDSYEPGSTFKIITAAAALEEGAVNLNTPFVCNGYKSIGNHRIGCHVTSGHGAQTFADGIKHSCNVVFMETGLKLGEKKFMEYFEAFGLTRKTGIELVGESGSIYYTDGMGDSDVATSAFGQGFQVTPLQMITAVSAVVNGGNLMKPQIVKEIRNEAGVVKSYQPTVVNKVISEETSAIMREQLENVVAAPDGTGKNAYIKGYRIGGKTGTSEKAPRGTNKRIASFIGFAPADDPEIVCLVMLDEPQVDNKYGGTIAAPLAGEIMEDVLDYLGVERQYKEGEEPDEMMEVPDMRDSTVDSAKYLAQAAGFKTKVNGKGDTVIDQQPKPGVTLQGNSTIVLYTEKVEDTDTVTVPNVEGMSISSARSALTSKGLNFEIVGAGQSESSGAYAVKQSVAAGEKVAPSTVIGVEFRHRSSD